MSLDNLSSFSSVLRNIKNAEILNNQIIQKDSLIFEYLTSALEQAKQLNDTSLIRFSFKKLIENNFDNNKLPDVFIQLCEEFKPYIKTSTDYAIYTHFKYSSIARIDNESPIPHYKKALAQLEDSNDNFNKGRLNQMTAVMLFIQQQNFKDGIIYLNEAEKFYKRVPGATGQNLISAIYNNLGIMHYRTGNPELGLEYLRKNQKIKKTDLRNISNDYLALSEAHEALKNYDSALYYAKEEKKTLEKFKEYESALIVREINTKYQTAEKEKQIIIEQQKKKRNATIALGLGTLLLFGGITFILIQKNTRRKQLLAEQEKELESQKVDGLMKTMELNAIDAMIKGQEKERQQIASDLHNDLGNLMTTLKLNFEALEQEPTPTKIKHSKKLLTNLYSKVRSISHEKNAGVFASQGLLKSLENLASTINETKKIHLEVQAHDMDEPLVSSLELTIFRIIQELITNMLKHAKATEGYIHLTNHGDHINVMIEDDGVGFNPKNAHSSNGMGIGSIQKHVENLGGTMSIDSSKNNGATFLINIPL